MSGVVLHRAAQRRAGACAKSSASIAIPEPRRPTAAPAEHRGRAARVAQSAAIVQRNDQARTRQKSRGETGKATREERRPSRRVNSSSGRTDRNSSDCGRSYVADTASLRLTGNVPLPFVGTGHAHVRACAYGLQSSRPLARFCESHRKCGARRLAVDGPRRARHRRRRGGREDARVAQRDGYRRAHRHRRRRARRSADALHRRRSSAAAAKKSTSPSIRSKARTSSRTACPIRSPSWRSRNAADCCTRPTPI